MADEVRIAVGDVRAVPVEQGWAVARVLQSSKVEFFAEPVSDLAVLTADVVEALRRRDLLFVLTIGRPTLRSERWPRIGKVSAAELAMVTELHRWKRDAITGKLSIYSQNLEIPGDSSERPATYDECVGLEDAAVWDDVHVESRLTELVRGQPQSLSEGNLDPAWRAANS